MFTKLLESGSRRTKNERWLSASTGVHLAIIAGAVTLTPQREMVRLDPPEQITTVYVDNAPGVKRLPSATPTIPHRQTGRWQLPSIRDITDVVGITVPNLDVTPGTGSLNNDVGIFDSRCDDTSRCSSVPALGRGPMSVGQVDKPAIELPGNPTPAYPAMLRTAGIEGSVLMRFVIDTTGVVEPTSIVVDRTDHELFSAAVKSVLLKNRFLPAEAAGRRVRMLVEQRFDFAIDK